MARYSSVAAAVEAEPEAKTVDSETLLLDRFARLDRRRALVLDHLARHQMAPVRCGTREVTFSGRPSMPPSSTAFSDL